MKKKLCILNLEDNRNDAELNQAKLAEDGFACDLICVETREDYLSAIEKDGIDIILADYSLPSFDGLAALKLARELCPDVPFIFVTGTMGEDVAVESLKVGATDYVIKDRLNRLAPSVRRALREAEEKIQRKQAKEALRESEVRFRDVFEQAMDCILLLEIRPDDVPVIRDANAATFRILGYDRGDLIDQPITVIAAEPDADVLVRERQLKLLADGSSIFEVLHQCKDGTVRVFECSIREHRVGLKTIGISIERDITDRKLAEEQIKNLAKFPEENPDPVIRVDKHGMLLYANKACHSKLSLEGFTIGNKAPKNIQRLTSAAIEEGESTEIELSIEERIYLVTVAPIVEAGYANLYYRDITERKQAEQELQFLSEWHQAILTAVPDIIAEVGVNKVYTWMNQAGIEFFGDDALGKKMMHYCEGSQETYRSIEPMFNGDPSIFEFENWQRNRDGAKRVLSWRCRALKDTNGKVIGALLVANDITERKREEQALRESVEKYRSLIEQSNDAIYLLVKEKFELVNRRFCELLEVTPEEVIAPDFSFMNLVAPLSRDCIAERRTMVLRGEEALRNYEFTALTKSGKEIILEASVSYFDYKGEIATQGILHDITQRKLLEAQFRQAQKMEAVGRLAGGVAHDFNNLLSVITGHAELAVMTLNPNDPLRDDFKIVQDAAVRASKLTKQLLAFSREQTLEPVVMSLNKIITDLEKMLCRIIGEDLEMLTYLNEELWMIKVDPGQIEQVIVNLVVNARDAMPAGGKLVLETSNVQISQDYVKTHDGIVSGDYVLLAVSDTGVGMPEEVRIRIFDPFFTTKSADKGTGLGLSTVYGIVKQSGGNISVYSEPGKGTTFKVYLPKTTEVAQEYYPHPKTSDVPHGIETVLVVDDEEGVREVLISFLKKLGYCTIEAKSSGDAYLICQKEKKPIDLVITDLVMPHMSGIELIEHIRKIWPDVKVLFMSGYAEGALAHQEFGALNAPFIEKPFTFAALGWKVREILDARYAEAIC